MAVFPHSMGFQNSLACAGSGDLLLFAEPSNLIFFYISEEWAF
jgi:hypothetical protein